MCPGLRFGRGPHQRRSQPRNSSKSSRSVGSCRSNDSTTGLSGPHSSANAGGSAHTICTSSAVDSSGYGACPCTARNNNAPSAHRSVAGPMGAANCQFSCTGPACSGAHRSVTGPTTAIRACLARSAARAVPGPRGRGAVAARSSQRLGVGAAVAGTGAPVAGTGVPGAGVPVAGTGVPRCGAVKPAGRIWPGTGAPVPRGPAGAVGCAPGTAGGRAVRPGPPGCRVSPSGSAGPVRGAAPCQEAARTP